MNLPFVSKQNLKVRSPKDCKDQTAKNSLEGQLRHAAIKIVLNALKYLYIKYYNILTYKQFSLISSLFTALLYKPVDRVTRSTLVLHVSKSEP